MLRIRVPATSANLGSGFDCLGLALPLYNEVEAKLSDKLIIHTGKGIPTDSSNLIIRAMKSAADAWGEVCPTVEMTQINGIPSTSGLGSSAACIVAGVLMASEFLGHSLPEQELLDLATRLDGHPDNVAPAIKGGITASVLSGGHVISFSALPSQHYSVALATPNFQLSTSKSRAVLPMTYSREDLVHSVAHATTTFAAFMSGEPTLLALTMQDRIHEPYRLPLIEGADEIFARFRTAGAYATYLSGAGPTLAAIVPCDFQMTVPKDWTLRVMNVASRGAEVLSKT